MSLPTLTKRQLFASALVPVAIPGATPSRMLMTGHTGRIGTSLQSHWSGRNITGLSLENCDLRFWNTEWADQFAGQDVVVHLAGYIVLADLPSNLDNLLIMANVLRACALHRVPRLVYASSQMVNSKQDDLGNDLCYYAAQKHASEHMFEAWGAANKAIVRCLRLGYFGTMEPQTTTELVRLNAKALHWWFDRALTDQPSDQPFQVWNAIGKLA